MEVDEFIFVLVLRLVTQSALFPYTTLFRSPAADGDQNFLRLSNRVRRAAQRAGLPGVRGITRRPARSQPQGRRPGGHRRRSEEHTSELQSQSNLVCRLLLEKTNTR